MKETKDYRKQVGKRIRIVQHLCDQVDQNMADSLGLSIQQYRKLISGMHEIGVDKLYFIIETLKPDMNYVFYGDHSNGFFFDKKITEEKDVKRIIKEVVAYTLNLPKKDRVNICMTLIDANKTIFQSIAQMDE
ncbi:MAG: hypothetical protein KBT48_01280 [Firmicutes bacterium]|nr:hypothetical protein [Bacillota bacterium]